MKAPDVRAHSASVPERLLQGGSIIHEHNIVYKISRLKKRFSADSRGVDKMNFFAGAELEAMDAITANEEAAPLLWCPQ